MSEKILLLQIRENGTESPERKLIAEAARRTHHDFEYRNFLTETLSDIRVENYSHIIMGGSGAVDISEGEKSWFDDAKRMIKDCEQYGVPFFGICFGMQMLAYAYGGKIVRGVANQEVGGISIRTHNTAGTFFEFLPAEFTANAVHRDFVTQLPLMFKNVGSSGKCQNHIILHRTKPLFGVQFHPEHDRNSLKPSLKKFADKYCPHGMETVLKSAVKNDPAVEAIIYRFLKL